MAQREAGLRVLQTYLQMKKPNDLLVEADKLRDRHRNSVEELIILSLIYHAFKQKGDVVRERQIRDQMKELFDRLPPPRSPPTRVSTAGRTGRRSGSRRKSESDIPGVVGPVQKCLSLLAATVEISKHSVS